MFAYAIAPILALAFLPSASAHGFVTKVVIDGTTYTGNVPNAKPSDSPIRQIDDIGPVKGADNPYMNCGQNAQLATMVVPANPGSSVAFYWGNPGQEDWPHNTGPLMTYMAPCDTSTCDKFNGSTAKWFKIDEIGKKTDGSTWYQADVMNEKPVTLTLPTQLSPGDYLVRHEIIALHLAQSQGGAEFYPSCTQIRVGGSQSGTPDQTASFPGAYSDNDPGIFVPNIYDPGEVYTFPGPPVSNLASQSDMASSNGGQAPSSPLSGGPPASSTPASGATSASSSSGSKSTSSSSSGSGSAAQPAASGSSKTCKLAKRSTTLARRSGAVTRHKRCTSFFRALRDAIHHS
ncbi:glycosyl hydrolase family 61-domain-containing protein [Gloeopeniophorella convolvens]|nr:glycosyl hydrolase family 61-domain-containing protein [Gloeopeniophorella convolvens]